MSRGTSPVNDTLAISFQLIGCTRCTALGKCRVTRELGEAAIEGRPLDMDVVEAIAECGGWALVKAVELVRGAKLTMDQEPMYWADLVPGPPCIVRLRPRKNMYAALLSRVAKRVVPPRGFLDDLLRAREEFVSMFLNDDGARASVILMSLGLGPLGPLVLMDQVEDIYLTHDSIYINHAVHGMCRVEGIEPRALAINMLKLANMGGVGISVDRPSGKFSLAIGGVRLRVTIDKWPLVEDVAVHIRRHKRAFTLTDLVISGTIDPWDAAKVVIALRLGHSLLVLGPPASGKTTILNALDMALPRGLRRIYIDEADESLDLPVPSVKVRALEGKVNEVLRSLHRGYGALIIGELREREHFEALVHGVHSGLQVMATAHADGQGALVARLRSFGLLGQVDLGNLVLVVMGRRGNVRFVREVRCPSLGVNEDLVAKVKDLLINLRATDIGDYVDSLDSSLAWVMEHA